MAAVVECIACLKDTTTAYGGKNYDVQTYVVGLGDSVQISQVKFGSRAAKSGAW